MYVYVIRVSIVYLKYCVVFLAENERPFEQRNGRSALFCSDGGATAAADIELGPLA